MICIVEGCEEKQRCKSLCQLHYTRKRLTGEVGSVESLRPTRIPKNITWIRPVSKILCRKIDCVDDAVIEGGLCREHISEIKKEDKISVDLPVCLSCNESKAIKARGMCKRCYEKWRKDLTDEERAVKKSNYPSNEEMVLLFVKYRTMSDVAKEIGIRRESLRDYLKIRPDLDEACRKYLGIPEEVKKQRQKNSQRNWVGNNRDKVREIKRRWASGRPVEDVKKWNDYNRERRKNQIGEKLSIEEALKREEYDSLIKNDLCVYCLGKVDTRDHIIAVNCGGTDDWHNMAPACKSCNSSKKDKSLLEFMLWRLDNLFGVNSNNSAIFD